MADADFAYTGTIIDYTVMTSGMYEITAAGGQGGGGYAGLGASISGEFSLAAGDELEIAVGGQGMASGGSESGSGGGGGSFVVLVAGSTDTALVIAGGGGGSGAGGTAGAGAGEQAMLTANGGNAENASNDEGVGGTDGNGGGGGGPNGGGGGGGGFVTNGSSGVSGVFGNGGGGGSFAEGLSGGNPAGVGVGGGGGFGGGGGGGGVTNNNSGGGGGGGGYSGGGGGSDGYAGASGYLGNGGGGGGSYFAAFDTNEQSGLNGFNGGVSIDLIPLVALVTLVNFNGTDGANSYATLTADTTGDLFGTTSTGGTGGGGTVFEIAKTVSGYASTPTTLANFPASYYFYDSPLAGVIADADADLFGTTNGNAGVGPYGTVFEIEKTAGGYASTPATLVSFGGADGALPGTGAGLIADTVGDLLGTTAYGGANDDGTVFEIAKNGTGYESTPTVLASFSGTNGQSPEAGLTTDTAGDLFGTTYIGGANNDGTVFEIAKTAGGYASTPTTLFSFNGSNGVRPEAGLTADASGDLFGTTMGGGLYGDGTVFEIAKTAGSYASTPITLVSFDGTVGTDVTQNGAGGLGEEPEASLIIDGAGNLFGTTAGGGANGDGTVFEIVKSGSSFLTTPVTLFSFDGTDGADPAAALTADTAGDLFGTTEKGGASGDGTAFELTGTGFQATSLVPPVTAAPSTSTVGQNQTTAISGVSLSETGNTAGETFAVTLADTHGDLSATGSGVSGSGTTSLTIAGSLGQVNLDLATLTDTEATIPSDTITLSATDGFGNFASPQQIAITVNGLPIIAGPTAATLLESQTTAISGVSLSETGNTAGETFAVTLADTHGDLSATGSGVSGSGTTSLTIAGSLGQVNLDLATLTDTEATIPSDTITLSATDSLGNSANQTQIAASVAGPFGDYFSADLWNIPSDSNASVGWNYDSMRGLNVNVNFTELTLSDPEDVVAGYPDITYGQNPFGGPSTTVASILQLPQQVSGLVQQSVWLSSSYSISNPNSVPLDFTYDMFLTADPATTTSSGPTSLGDSLELMIWTDEQNGLTPSSASPSPVTSLVLPTWINGQSTEAEWNVFVGPGGSDTQDITFELAQPIATGSISLDLSAILAKLNAPSIANADGVSAAALGTLYLDDIQLGTEFTPPTTGSVVAPDGYNWTLSQFSIGNGPPTSTALTAIEDQPSTGDLNAGEMVVLTLDLSAAVTVTGAPTLTLNDGATATYTSGSGSNALVFNDTVSPSDVDVASLAVTAVNLNGGTIEDGNGNNANLSLTGLPQSGPQIDTGSVTGPVISNTTNNQETLVAPLANTTIEGGDYDILNLSQNPIANASSAYTITPNENGSFTLATNGSTDTVSGIMQVEFSNETVTIANNDSPNEYIALLYQGALDRTPDSVGLAGWEQIDAALPASTQTLGPYGLSDASGNYNGSLSIAAGFTNSPEFIAEYGSLTNAQFVTDLYANILDRAPDPTGYAGWMSQLSSGTTREHVLVGFADSAEAISNATLGFTGQSGYHAPWLDLLTHGNVSAAAEASVAPDDTTQSPALMAQSIASSVPAQSSGSGSTPVTDPSQASVNQQLLAQPQPA